MRDLPGRKWDEALQVGGVKWEGISWLTGLGRVEHSPGGSGGAQTNWDQIVTAFGCYPKVFSCFLDAVLL